jgi:hypothetical protein
VTRETSVVDGRRLVVPYVAKWSGEPLPDVTIVERRRGGIGYARERLLDRDEHGVLWMRCPSSPGRGRPEFGKVHTMRQRRAMARLLCQVCGGPADRDADGAVLWLWKDQRDQWNDWTDWPEGMLSPDPPVCLPCVALAVRLCPALRHGALAMRVGYCPVVGVYGAHYVSGPDGPVPSRMANVRYDNPRIGWVQADHLLRQLWDCTLISLDDLPGLGEVSACPS